jgi:hypothetical protein
VRRDALNLMRDIVVGFALSWKIKRVVQPGRPLVEVAADQKRKSDTVFILGSGASICHMTENDFFCVSSHDSIGLNHWPLHDFVPDYLLFEASAHPERVSALLETLRRKVKSYGDVPLIIDYRSWSRYGVLLDQLPTIMHGNIYLHVPWWLASIKPAHVRIGLRFWNMPWRRRMGDTWRLVHHRGGLATAVSFAYLAGYRRIVLAGVDLNDSKFFWEEEREMYAHLPTPPRTEIGIVHSSVDPDLSQKHHTLPMDEYLLLFYETVLKPSGVELLNCNPVSRLASTLPLYSWSDN